MFNSIYKIQFHWMLNKSQDRVQCNWMCAHIQDRALSYWLSLFMTNINNYFLIYASVFTERGMDNYTTAIQIFNDTTPKLPKTPLYQEVSEDFGFIFYVSIILIGTLLLLYLCNCFFRSHKYHSNDGLLKAERLQMI